MTLTTLLIVMFLAVIVGKRNTKFGKAQYLIAAILALIQTAMVIYRMITMKMPPLF
jgi:hypothetical protein